MYRSATKHRDSSVKLAVIAIPKLPAALANPAPTSSRQKMLARTNVDTGILFGPFRAMFGCFAVT